MRSLFILVSLVAWTGCSDGNTECASAADCFAGESCVDDVCVPALNNAQNNTANNTANNTTNNTTNNANQTNNATTNNAATNNSTTNNSTTNNSSNNATNNTINNATGVCLVDAFASCEDPLEDAGRNDSWADADRPGRSLGCPSGDMVEPATWSVDGQLCGREEGDWYGQIVIPCDTYTLVATARATPDTPCDHAEWDFVFNRGGARIACEDPNVQCSTEGDAKILKWTIPPSGSLSSYYIGVEGPGAQFGYKIDFSIE